MKKQFISLFILLCSLTVSLFAQTENDSIVIVSAQWEITKTSDQIVHKRGIFTDLYKGPQYINIIEIPSSKKLHFDIAVSEMKQTSLISREHQALASINGSFYNMKEGFSVCYLGKGKEVIDYQKTPQSVFLRALPLLDKVPYFIIYTRARIMYRSYSIFFLTHMATIRRRVYSLIYLLYLEQI